MASSSLRTCRPSPSSQIFEALARRSGQLVGSTFQALRPHPRGLGFRARGGSTLVVSGVRNIRAGITSVSASICVCTATVAQALSRRSS